MILSKCEKCGVEHGMVVENMETGEEKPFAYCQKCFSTIFQVKFDPIMDLEDLDKFTKKLKEWENEKVDRP